MIRALRIVAILALVLVACLIGTQQVSAVTEHCPDHEVTLKIEVGTSPSSGSMYELDYVIDGPTVTFEQVVTFCVKAGPYAGEKITGTTFTVDWLNKGDQTPNISYVVVYSIEGGNPSSTPTPSPSPSPSTTPTPSPSSTPTNTPTPDPSSGPTSSPTTPTVTNTPTPSVTDRITIPDTAMQSHTLWSWIGWFIVGFSLGWLTLHSLHYLSRRR